PLRGYAPTGLPKEGNSHIMGGRVDGGRSAADVGVDADTDDAAIENSFIEKDEQRISLPDPDNLTSSSTVIDSNKNIDQVKNTQTEEVKRKAETRIEQKPCHDNKKAASDARSKRKLVAKSVNILELCSAPGIYEGKQVWFIGKLHKKDPMVRKDFGKDMLVVYRFVISCCVADATPVAVLLDLDDSPTLSEDSWVRVEGRFTIEEKDGNRVPIILNPVMKGTEKPSYPYLY
ncbi:MAG: hypothetical protein JXR97_16650, partial [Planctomycetes bacterium]|nr:hypothetical protein [Planctomycetota bacterium]